MPVHIKGGGGVGFPPDWKEHFKGIVHEAAIAKGDPVVTGIYSNVESGMDVRNLSVPNTYFNTFVNLSPDSEMFAMTSGLSASAAAGNEKYIYIWNSTTLVFDKVAIPVGTTAFTSKLGAAFSKDNQYLALLVSTAISSGSTYLKLYKINGVGASRTLEFMKELFLTNYAAISCIDFFDYLNDPTKLRIVACAMGASALTGYLVKYDTTTQTITGTVLGTISLSSGFVKYDEYTLISVAADTYCNRRYHADIANDTFNATYDKYVSSQTAAYRVYDFTDDHLYAVLKNSSVSPYFKVYKDDGTFTWTAIANPDVLPAGSVIDAAFSPGGTYLAVGLSVSPWLVIYKRVGDVLTKIANPTTMPTKGVYDVNFSDDGKLLFVAQGDATAATGVFCYGFEAGNIVSKITSFSANPLSWFPAGRKKFGIALDAGAIGSEIRVNLFPKLNNMLPQ